MAALPQRPYLVLLVATLLAAAVVLWREFPFAFYSPDGSFHAAKLLRATEDEPFRDPFSGTLSLYPALFHALFGGLNRLLELSPLELVRFIQVLDFVGLFAAFFLFARAVLKDPDLAALVTLALALAFYSPTGRHILTVGPSNFALLPLFGSFGLLYRYVESGQAALLGLGLFLAAAAVNVVWYDSVPVAAILTVVAYRIARRGRWSGSLGLASLCLLIPFAFTACHLYAIRSVLPDYSSFTSVELARHEGGVLTPAVVVEWLQVVVTKANHRFEASLQRSAWAFFHYYGLVLPFALCVLAVGTFLFWRLRPRAREAEIARARLLYVTAVLVFALSLLLAVTRDAPRVARVQFAGWGLLLAFVFRAAQLVWSGARVRRLGPVVAGAAIVSMAYTVKHTEQPFSRGLPRPTQAVVDFIARLPGHPEARLLVTESNLRRLAPFVTFQSFVNHGDGRYYAQDPVSSARLLAAYRTLVRGSDAWDDTLRSFNVRFAVFRHAEGGPEREAALFYLARGRAVLANEEWWVIEPGADRRPR